MTLELALEKPPSLLKCLGGERAECEGRFRQGLRAVRVRRLAALDGLFLVLLLGWNDEATFARGEMDAVTVVSLENEKVKGTVEVGRLFETKVGVDRKSVV